MHLGLQIRAMELTRELSAAAADDVQSLNMDEDSFRLLYEPTARPLFNYLLHASGRRDVADDVLQESYCRLLSAKLPAMNGAQLKSYLFRIATNLLRDRWRRIQESTLEAQVLVAPEPNPEFQVGIRRAF